MKNTDRSFPVPGQRLLFGVLLFCAFVLLLISSFRAYGNIRSPGTQEESAARELPAVSASSTLPLYILREYRQKIGIFEMGESIPVQVLDVYVFTLPKADQTALAHGIRIYSNDALQARIEDFTG